MYHRYGHFGSKCPKEGDIVDRYLVPFNINDMARRNIVTQSVNRKHGIAGFYTALQTDSGLI